ncbi:MAG: hypothetical protein OER86_14420, partial [Phycisphaerae bacterium]|nr:hypothetical protein [Phycisphaerae bacterium]
LLTLSLVSGGQVSPERAAEMRFASEAQKIADLGLSITIMAVRKNPDWRKQHIQGTWVDRKPFGGGSFSIVVQDGADANGNGRIDADEGDGDLAGPVDEDVTLLCWAEYEGIVRFAGGVVRPSPFKLQRLRKPPATARRSGEANPVATESGK